LPLNACFCNQNSEANPINITKSLFINDPNILTTLSSTFGFHHLLDAMRGNIDYNTFLRSYIDGYRMTSIESSQVVAGELNDIRSRNSSANFLFNNFTPFGPIPTKTFNPNGSPYRLIALVYRPDLFGVDANGNVTNAGEFRFIFKINDNLAGTQSGIRLRNHVIFEYKLPLETATLGMTNIGAFSREDWSKELTQLNCLEGVAYTNHLINIASRVALAKYPTNAGWVNGSAIGQLRVNDFLQIRSDQSVNGPISWSLFEYRLRSGGAFNGQLRRHRMPKTPKDNYSDVTSALVVNSDLPNLAPNGSTEISNFFIGSFNSIKDQTLNYDLSDKLKAWHLEYRVQGTGTNWGQVLKTKEAQNTPPFSAGLLNQNESSFAKYRFSLNTCNSCHSGAFNSHNGGVNEYSPSLAVAGANLGIGTIDFSNINNTNFFVHVEGTNLPNNTTSFLNEDLLNRKEELELFIGVTQCLSDSP